MGHVLDHPDLADERVGQRALRVVDRADGHTAGQGLHPFGGGAGLESLVQHLGQRIPIVLACLDGREPRVLGQFGPANAVDQGQPEFLHHAHQEHPAILRPHGLYRGLRGMRATRHARRHGFAIQMPVSGIGKLLHRDLEQRHVHIAALARGFRPHQAGEQPDGAVRPGHVVDHRGAQPRGRAVGLPRQAHQPALGLHQVVIARPSAALIIASIGRDMQADDGGVQGGKRGIVQPQRLRLITAQVVHHGIRCRDQPGPRGTPLIGLQIQRDALLVPGPCLEIEAVIVAQHRAHAAAGIAPGRAVFDLDDLRPQIRKVHGPVGRRAELFQRQDAQPLQRLHQTGFRLMCCLAMIMRCISLVPSPMHNSGASR